MIIARSIIGLGACSEDQPETALLPNVFYTSDARKVLGVQSALRQGHYYAAEIDVFFQKAIQRFQMDHGLQVNPVISRSLLAALGIADGSPAYR